jgi:hypothetical protein
MTLLVLLVLPISAAVSALARGYLPAKMAVPILCAGIIAIVATTTAGPDTTVTAVVPLILALAFSAAGDFFLSTKDDRPTRFVVGIGAYLLAHLGYGIFAVGRGGVSVPALIAALVLLFPYFVLALRPAIADRTLLTAVLLYLLVSCLVLAAAIGMQVPAGPKALYITAIALIVISDFIISLKEFVGYHALDWLILPIYYAAHLSVTTAVVLLFR